MRLWPFVVAVVAVLLVVSGSRVVEAADGVPSNGLGDHFDWTSWDLAPEKAFEAGRPLMVILHKSWCPACKKLKEWFGRSEAISGLSKAFVMVNADEKGRAYLHSDFILFASTK